VRERSGEGRPRVVVIGGGIAGLAAAHRLTRLTPRVEVTLLEAGDRLGGKILTERIGGFTIEAGPDSFLAAKPRGVGLCEELGIGQKLQGTTPRRRRAFVFSRGRLHDLPEGLTGLVPTRLGPMLRTRLVSPRAKARLALDYVLPPRRGADDESLAGFVRRRLGREVYDRLVEPLMAGI
jgi:oxygen-dependent protoporphyrinogen oxidase